ncbi:MAG: hypothetical protein AB1597_00440 [Chloroflexota bacterium]
MVLTEGAGEEDDAIGAGGETDGTGELVDGIVAGDTAGVLEAGAPHPDRITTASSRQIKNFTAESILTH